MASVLFGKNDIRWCCLPVNSQIRVIPCESPLGLRRIVIVAFVLEYHGLSQHAETMGETPGNEYLTVILSGKFHGNVPAECRRTFPYVHSHIKNRPADYPDKLGGFWK